MMLQNAMCQIRIASLAMSIIENENPQIPHLTEIETSNFSWNIMHTPTNNVPDIENESRFQRITPPAEPGAENVIV